MKTVTSDRLRTMQDEGKDFLLVNTLDPEHFAETKIPGSINIPQSQPDFTDKVLEASESKQKLVVVYCASEECDSSTKAAEKLERDGFAVADFEGGADAWQEAGQPLAT